MNAAHTHYSTLKYDWTLYEDDTQITCGGFETKARCEYESNTARLAGELPVKVYHKSAYMKSRKQAEFQLRALDKYPSGSGNWGAWRAEKEEGCRSVPLIVNGQEAFRLYLEMKSDA